MIPDHKILPPLDYLVAFEFAARLGGFASAAKHLNVSESAVSRKIRLLEAHYNLQLFDRNHRSVTLTKHGLDLLPAVTEAFDILRNKSEDLGVHHQIGTVTVAATNSVSSLWLSPRLAKFHALHKDILIMLTSSDRDEECLKPEVDYPILRGDGDWPGFESEMLFGETIFPVCAPSYVDQHPECRKLAQVPHHDLIEISSHHSEWMNWKNWLGEQGIQNIVVERTAMFNTYPLAVQAAIDGLGLVLGWKHLVDKYLDSGHLVRPLGRKAVQTEFGYYLLRRKGQKYNAAQSIVESWLLAEGALPKREG